MLFDAIGTTMNSKLNFQRERERERETGRAKIFRRDITIMDNVFYNSIEFRDLCDSHWFISPFPEFLNLHNTST